ncbi:uncharacterized protein LOC116804163 isoform X2 [Drosophila mojavensis]|uniref:uncharacterized protein LOC116804163 isoform X2 n=1 Tax=Drosophila mojavensis TaxID=7230 RepID=UPI001CD0EF76|nr:uncharacterized protein LOC116804163 isoform X2 [Drosophila mojavensis]
MEPNSMENKNSITDCDALRSKKSKRKNVEHLSTKILSRLLLTLCMGLLIIALIIYIVFRLKSECSPAEDVHNMEAALGRFIEESNELDSSAELLGLITGGPEGGGCYEDTCRIECSQNVDLYADAAAVMSGSECEVITSLIVTNQSQNYIADNWIDSNATVLRIALIKSELTKIKSGAFDAPMFSKVLHMIWLDLKLNEVSNGALLGLYSLKKFEIDFKVPNIQLALLQPVQLTLTHLRMNCGINFKSGSNIFENIYLGKLLHLDLSYNNFSGPLTKNIFIATPNVTYLYLKYCQITAIEDSAFEHIAQKLILVDLKHNLLTHFNADSLGLGKNLRLFDVEPNNWNCTCQLRSMIEFYNKRKSYFISAPYCRMPLKLYGKNFDELTTKELGCDTSDDDTDKVTDPIDQTPTDYDGKASNDNNNNNEAKPTIPYGAILQFSCSKPIAITESEDSIEDRQKRYVTNDSPKNSEFSAFEHFVFEPPTYDLDLEILENYTVRASIDGYDVSSRLNIIWFTEHENTETYFDPTPSSRDYNCMLYEDPYLVTDPLRQNHTYTFCMMAENQVVVSPLFCQPLHIPLPLVHNEMDDVIEVETDKQFTIGMLCLIFFMSIVFGAVFAYLGIKSFPNLLEGSKNVVVIKESDKTCFVSTITESKYMKTSFKKDKCSFRTGAEKTSDVFTEPSDIKVPNSASVSSSSTCFDECFTSISNAQAMEYEMPMKFNESRKLSEGVDRPNTPPPLPKRNSKNSLTMDLQPLSCEKFAKQI